MEYVILSTGTSICIVLSVLMAYLMIRGLHLVLIKKGEAKEKRERLVKRSSFLFIGWMLGISIIAATGFFMDFSLPPRFFLVLATMLTVSLLITFSKRMTELLEFVPPNWLLYVQFFRVPVELMLWRLFLEGITPVQMTFEGRNWDILVGLTGPVFAYFCFRKNGWGRKVAIWWNIGGLALLLNIVVVAILSFPTPFRVFMNEPANIAVAQFPMILLPAILVTIAFSMHFFSLRQLTVHKNRFTNS